MRAVRGVDKIRTGREASVSAARWEGQGAALSANATPAIAGWRSPGGVDQSDHEASVLLHVTHGTVLESDLHILVHVDLLRPQIDNALGLSQSRSHLIDRLSL